MEKQKETGGVDGGRFGGVFTSYLRAASQRHQIVDSAEREPINALFRLNLGSFN